MLVISALFMVAVSAFGRKVVFSPGDMVLYYVIFATLGEFFWAWMAADHGFSTIFSWRHRGRVSEWALTRLGADDVVAGVARPGLRFLTAGILLHSALEAAIPFGIGTGPLSSPQGSLQGFPAWLLYLAIVAAIAVSRLQTCGIVFFASAREAFQCSLRDGLSAWAFTLLGMGARFLAAIGGGLLVLILIVRGPLASNFEAAILLYFLLLIAMKEYIFRAGVRFPGVPRTWDELLPRSDIES